MKIIFAIAFLLSTFTAFTQQDNIKPIQQKSASKSTKQTGFHYNPDAGLQYRNGDFQWTTWAFGERLFSPAKSPAWRRLRQGMEFQLPSYPFTIKGNKYRTTLFYEVDFTDNNFFKDSKRFKILENLFVSFQDAKDANKFRILFGENTHILSREDNLSSSNLPTINRSLILEQHGSTNSFGTQWGFQMQTQVSKKTFVQASLQDNRGSLNQYKPSYQFWNGIAVKITQSILQHSESNNHKLNVGFAIDDTRNIRGKSFALLSGIHNNFLGSTPATGNKLTFENNADYTNSIGKHFYTVEYEAIYSNYSIQKLHVAGGYAQFQYQLFDGYKLGDLVPFLRYDVVNLSNVIQENANEQAVKIGFNYNVPFTRKLVNFHAEYAHHVARGSATILSFPLHNFNEFRLELRINATRYLRF